MRQLFPLKIVQLDPRTGSADTRYTAEAEDGLRYLVKENCPPGYPGLPANEWICSALAEAVNIPVPFYLFLEMPNGDLVYGSRWVPSSSEARRLLLDRSIPQVRRTLSRLYAFDLFVHNDDRHAGNYLAFEVDGLKRLFAMDFSRSWTYHGWPLPSPPPAPQPDGQPCNTLTIARFLRKYHSFDEASAVEVLDRLRQVPVDYLKSVLAAMPHSWMPNTQQALLLSWWDSQDRTNRLDSIARGLRNGTYL